MTMTTTISILMSTVTLRQSCDGDGDSGGDDNDASIQFLLNVGLT